MTWSLSSLTCDFRKWWPKKAVKRPVERLAAPVHVPPQIDESIAPDPQPRAWVIFFGHLGYIDHEKSDGRYGVRPVDRITGKELPNKSRHWSMADRLRIPQEFALEENEFRPARQDELPRYMRDANHSRFG